MNIKKIVGGICTIAAAPVALAVVANVAATTGAIAVVTGISKSVAVSAGVAAMRATEKAAISAGASLILDGLSNK